MANIQIKSLKLTNFKGIREANFTFSKNTDIFGDNSTGKTTLFDAFTWLLFGKDSADRKDFEVKTLDADNKVIEKLEHEVSAIIEVDGLKVNPKRVLREKWTTKRGSSLAEFTGNETVYFWNDVPVSQSEFNGKVSAILDEKVFKLITNPLYFNEALKWIDRRAVLMDMAGLSGEKVNDLLPDNQQDFLRDILNQGKTLAEYAKELSARRKNLKDEIMLIPARVDEATRSLPEARDYSEIKLQIKAKQELLDAFDKQINNIVEQQRSQQRQQAELEDALWKAKSAIRKAEMEYSQSSVNQNESKRIELNSLKSGIQQRESEINSKKQTVERLQRELDSLNERKAILRKEYDAEQARVIVISRGELSETCPTCGQQMPDEILGNMVEALKEVYDKNLAIANQDKADNIARLVSKGKSVNEDIKRIEQQISDTDGQIKALELFVADAVDKSIKLQAAIDSHKPEIKADFTATDTFTELGAKVAKIEQQIVNLPTLEDVTADIKAQRYDLILEVDELKASLSNEGIREKQLQRIEELKASEKSLAQQLADIDGIEAKIKDIEYAKINIMESRVNGLFGMVKFKLFNQLINGGIEETCETLVNGVPFGSLNNAAKINSGLDIINALCAHYGSTAPIFVDNAEAVTRLIATKSQLIRLVVSEADKTLRIVNN